MKRCLFAAVTASAGLAGPLACRSVDDTGLITASGHVEATDVRISTKVAGRLVSMAPQEGDSVAAGQEIARLDTTDLRLALEKAAAEREQAAAELRLRLAGARKEDVAELESQIASTEADREGAQRELDRMQALLDKGSGTGKARDDALTRRDMTLGRLAAQKQALLRLKSGSRAEEKDAARARLAAASAGIAQLEQQITDAAVKSPTSGVVTERLAEPGELLQAGSPLCVVTNLKDAWLTVYVGDLDLPRIRIGQEAEVKTDAGQARQGKITFIASQAEFTPKNVQTRDERVKLVYKVKVGLDNAESLFKPGMPAEALFRAAGGAQ